MRRWVCEDWYWDTNQLWVGKDGHKPEKCFFKSLHDLPLQSTHTLRCGVRDITMTPVEAT